MTRYCPLQEGDDAGRVLILFSMSQYCSTTFTLKSRFSEIQESAFNTADESTRNVPTPH